MAHTLVLGPDYQPVSHVPLSTVSWQHAFKLYFMGKADIVEEYEDWLVHTVDTEMHVPAVIALKKGYNKRMPRKFTRENLYVRDMYTCQYCGDAFPGSQLTIDHVVPRSLGGATDWDNCVAACRPCNTKKSSKLIKPLNQPYRPSYYQLTNILRNSRIQVHHPSWIDYIGLNREPIVVNQRPF
jgi:5-methylcytosine-specific restriction endonuclease McrA